MVENRAAGACCDAPDLEVVAAFSGNLRTPEPGPTLQERIPGTNQVVRTQVRPDEPYVIWRCKNCRAESITVGTPEH